jgi:UDP-N-acetylmuramoylalanine--D-glutamate ligase
VRERLLVYGLGRSGGAVVARALREGHEVVFMDRRDDGDDIAAALALGARRVHDVELADVDLCVAAPGVPITHPDLARLRARGVETIGEVEWIQRALPAARMVGITGTAGKGSVTRWLTDTLQGAGIDAVAGGNIDPALAAVARADATLVVELSSFQLERCPTLRPDVATVLNLGIDHLDRHGDLATYHGAKRAIIAHLGPEQAFVYNADDPRLREWAATSPATLLPYGVLGAENGGAARGGGEHGYAARDGEPPLAARCDASTGTLYLHDEPLLAVSELAVTGRHQYGNALAVALVADRLGVAREAIRHGLRAFRGLPGRYATVGTLGAVRFVEDSIATRQLAVEAALAATPGPVVWIAGGVDKGSDLAALEGVLREKVTLLLGIGASGPDLVAGAASWIRAERVAVADGRAALREAVRRGFEHLLSRHGGSGSVLLAPLAASFDQFRDYRDRADAFRAAVEALVGEVQGVAALRGEEVAWTPSS